jgi:hypothetical protein
MHKSELLQVNTGAHLPPTSSFVNQDRYHVHDPVQHMEKGKTSSPDAIEYQASTVDTASNAALVAAHHFGQASRLPAVFGQL